MNDARGTRGGEREKMLENGRSDPGTGWYYQPVPMEVLGTGLFTRCPR